MIRIKKERVSIYFADLDEGQFFLLENNLYLKTSLILPDLEDDFYNAYMVQEEELDKEFAWAFFHDEDEIYPVDVTITIE